MRLYADLGLRVYGLAGVALGAVDLAFVKLAEPWQALPAFIPFGTFLAIPIGLGLLLAGAGLQLRRTAVASAFVLGAIYLIFAMGWTMRFAATPALLAVLLGVCEQLALVIGGLCCWLLGRPNGNAVQRLFPFCRIGFGLCCLVFGAAHFVYAKETAAMVPAWLPPGGLFWAYATGIAHALAGIALVCGIRALTAARLLTAMFVTFGLLVWLPILFTAPDALSAWGGNAVNLALAGAAWCLSDTIAGFSSPAAPAA
jgi:hypothetical protein